MIWFIRVTPPNAGVYPLPLVLTQSFDAAANGLTKPTIVRTRGTISIAPQSGSADLDIVGAWGAAIVSDQAFAAGQASIPGPFDEAGWDGWYAWGSFSYQVEFFDSTGVQAPWDRMWEIDSKAMRKITDNETIVFMVESNVGAFSVSLQLRTLLKLS